MLITEETTCNLCGSGESRPLLSETYRLNGSQVELEIRRCRGCDLVYTSPRLTFESTLQVYADDAEHTISHNYCWDGSNDGSRFENLLNRLRELAPEGRLLDVGCGGGHLLAEARAAAPWELIGVDPSQQAAEQTRARVGCEVFATSLEEADIQPASCEIVTMLGVLEHLHDPLGTLNSVGGLIKADGLLAVYVPNFNYLRLKDSGLLAYLRRGRWSDLHPQEHLHHFTPQTLRALLNSAGFDVLQMEIGHPFMQGSPLKRTLKKSAYHAVRALKSATGIHFGGLEAIARYRGPATTAVPTDQRTIQKVA